MATLFLSYARGDDELFVQRLHGDLTMAGFDVWFDRVSMPSRSLTFHQEIRDAIASRDRLILVVGPKAKESLYVRQEWQFAYFWDADGAATVEKIVVPILRLGEMEDIPDELKLLHCEDFRDDSRYDFHLKKLIQQLSEPAPPLGKLIGVPSLPPHFLSRADRLTALRDALRTDLDRPVVITGAAARIGMHGMGGIGKSVLAAMLSRDRKIREAFPDGIVWVGLGTQPSVADLQRRVHKDLAGDGAFQTEHEGRFKLREILKDKAVLLILDDVWRREDVDWFDVLGPRCRAMITTRDASLLKSLGDGKSVHYRVELLSDAEALSLLAQAAGVDREKLPDEAADLIAECGRLPLAVALCGGLIRDGFACAKVLEQLRTSRIERINDPHAAKVEHENIWNAIDASVKFLSADEQTRFLELAVFPPDEETPIAATRTLWSHTAGFDEWDTDSLVIKLSQRSLLELSTSAAGKAISLHDLVYDYVHLTVGDEVALHQRLLEAYRQKCPNGWHVDPPHDGYFFTHLRHHLIAGGRSKELADLLHELCWLEEKNEAGLMFDLTTDFDAAINTLPETDPSGKSLRLIDEALRRDLHYLSRQAIGYPQAIFQYVWNAGWWYDCPQAALHYTEPDKGWPSGFPPWTQSKAKLSNTLESWRASRVLLRNRFQWVCANRPPQLHLGSNQRSVLRGHGYVVRGVAYSADGGRLASGSWDGTVRLWDTGTGAELAVLKAGDGAVGGVAFSPDGRRVASGLSGGAVLVWDLRTGAVLVVLTGHEEAVRSVCFSPDGFRVVSGSEDRTVRVWDANSGAELFVLRGHESRVKSVAYSPDGSRIVSCSGYVFDRDHSVRVWDAVRGTEIMMKEMPYLSITFVAYSPDGSRIVTSGRDIQLWDAKTWVKVTELLGHKDEVHSVSFSPDGQYLASGSYDHTVRIWDLRTGEERALLLAHGEHVQSVAYSPDGRHVASGSSDRTVRIWDTQIEAPSYAMRAHECRFLKQVAYSPDGDHIACASFDGIAIWDSKRGVQVSVLSDRLCSVNCVAYSPDGMLLASGASEEFGYRDQSVVILDAVTGNRVAVFRGHSAEVICVTFSPDSRFVASGSKDNTIRIWDIEKKSELCSLRGHTGSVFGLSFSLAGNRLASSSSDDLVRIWDISAGRELAAIPGHNEYETSVAYSPDGRRLATSSFNRNYTGTVRVWDTETYECLEVIEATGDSRRIADVSAVAAGAVAYPLRAVVRGTETLIEDVATGQVLARFPVAIDHLATHPSSRQWAGTADDYLYLITLESSGP